MSTDDRELFELEASLQSLVDEALIDELRPRDLRRGAEVYETEETDDPYGDLVLVRKSDGARFEVEASVFVRRLKPRPAAAVPDEIPQCDGQEALPFATTGTPA